MLHGCRQLVPWGCRLNAITSATPPIVTNRLCWGLCRTAIVRWGRWGWRQISTALTSGLPCCYNGGTEGCYHASGIPIPKPLSSDWSLQPDFMKLDSLVIASATARWIRSGPCTHRPSSHGSWGYLEVRNRKERPRVKLVTGAKSNKVAVPEGAAGTPPFWRGPS